jgi:hypothetical protein
LDIDALESIDLDNSTDLENFDFTLW